MNVRWTTTIFVAAMLLLSGCTGGGAVAGGADVDPNEGDGAASDSGTSDADAGVAFQAAEDFEEIQTERQMADYIDRMPMAVFRPGETFRYEGANGFGEVPQPFTLSVESGDGGEWLEADVVVTIERADGSVTNSADSPSVLFAPEYTLLNNGRAFLWLYRFNYVTDYQPRVSELSVGDTWNFETPDEGAEERPPHGFDFTVTEKRTYAGVDCLVVVTEAYEGDERYTFSEACVASDVGLPIHYTMFDDSGDVTMEAELVEYSR